MEGKSDLKQKVSCVGRLAEAFERIFCKNKGRDQKTNMLSNSNVYMEITKLPFVEREKKKDTLETGCRWSQIFFFRIFFRLFQLWDMTNRFCLER